MARAGGSRSFRRGVAVAAESFTVSNESPATKLGDYELVAKVAQGGMATLYLAHKAGAEGKPLAVKVIHPHLQDDWEATRWFIDEALIAIRLKHPNVVAVHELGEEDGTYFLAMEYVHGCTLANLLGLAQRRGVAIDPRVVAWIGSEVCKGLHVAHELKGDAGEPLNVIHRDMSPQNVLLSHTGDVKLIDFGVAKAEGRARRTSHGEVRGKLRYMSPEQAAAEPLDRRADLFSLGVVLWEAAAQRRLNPDLEMAELLEALRNPQVPPLPSVREGIPHALDEAVQWATLPRAEHRPSTAADLGALLADAAGDVGRAELTELMRRLLGKKLVESARSFPKPFVEALALEHLEPTNPRGEGTGPVPLDRPEPAAPADPSERRRRVRAEPETSSQAWLLIVMLALAMGAIAAAAAYLL